MLRRLLLAIALLLATLSAPVAQPARQHAVADGCFPPVEAPYRPVQASPNGVASRAATYPAGALS